MHWMGLCPTLLTMDTLSLGWGGMLFTGVHVDYGVVVYLRVGREI